MAILDKLKIDLFSIVKLFSLLTVYIFFIGWVYCYYLFKHLGILYCLNDMPIYFLLSYSFPVIDYYLPNYIYIFLFLLTLLFFICLLSLLPQKLIHIILLFIFLLIFPFFHKISYNVALKDEIRIRNKIDVKRINIIFKEGIDKQYDYEIKEAIKNDNLLFLTKTKDSYLVLVQEGPKDNVYILPFGKVYDIPVSEVSHVIIKIDNIIIGGKK